MGTPRPRRALPDLRGGGLAAGKLALDEVGTNATLSGGEYYLNHAADEGGKNRDNFAKMVVGNTIDETKQDILAAWNVPFRKAQEVLRSTDKARDSSRWGHVFCNKPGHLADTPANRQLRRIRLPTRAASWRRINTATNGTRRPVLTVSR